MSKFTERMFFFVFTPLAFLWGIRTALSQPDQCASLTDPAQASGCALGSVLALVVTVLLPISIGFVVRRRRIKKEKSKKQSCHMQMVKFL